MSFEISHPIQFVSQPEFAMEFAHSKQQQISSSPYNNATIDKSSIGTQDFYVDFDHPSTHSSSCHHGASSVIPAPNSLVAAQTPPNQFEPYSTDLDLSISSLSSAPPLRKKDHRPCLEQLSPLPANTPMYESQVIQSSEADIKVSMARITDMIHSQQQMIWKQDLCSPPLATTNTSWTQPQQQDAFGLSTATTTVPRSLSDNPSLRYRNSNDPPCNCIPMIQYDPIYNHSETLSVPYYDLPALPLATSTSPPSPFTAMHSDLAKNNTKIMGYCHGSQHRLSMDQFYQHSYLDLSPSSSSSLSDDYSQQHHSMNNNLDHHIGTNPITSTSTSSSNTGSATTTTSTPRRYKCNVCVKRFTRPSSLATHMHSHTGEKPYKCIVDGCGRRFSVVSNLRRHAKIHLHGASMSGRKLQLV